MPIDREKKGSSKGVLVGTCGFAEAQQKTFRDFDILEVQQTFYQPPRVSTAEHWRANAPASFVFTMKAWQLLTHQASSPTYRRLKKVLSDTEQARVGNFRWNATTRVAWERTQEIAAVLDAEAIVFQTPRSFLPSRANIRRLYQFFEHIDRHGRRMVFEPRGEAWDAIVLRPVLRDLHLVHGVDPFLTKPLGRGMRYFRLHGRPAYHYHYRYSDEELNILVSMLSRAWPTRVLFNNDVMVDDARRFLKLIGGSGDQKAI